MKQQQIQLKQRNKQTNKPPLGGMAQSAKFSVLKHEDATLRHTAPT